MLRWRLWRSRSAKPAARVAAVRQLGCRTEREAIRRLIELLKDPSAMVRVSAATALRGACDPEAFEPLTDALRNGVTEAAGTLGRMRDPRAIQVLVETLPRARDIALQVLEQYYPGWRQSQEARLAIPALIAAWENGQEDQQFEAASWLGAFRDTRAISPLLRAFTSRDLVFCSLKLRTAALRALDSIDAGWARREEALAAVPEMASRACLDGCQGSKRALSTVGTVAPKALVEALCHDDWAVRHGARTALSDILSPEAVAPLLAVIQKPEAAVFAQEALLKLLKSAVKSIRPEDLQELAKLRDLRGIRWELKYACNVGPVDSAGSEVSVNCGHLRQLARQELMRRGPEV